MIDVTIVVGVVSLVLLAAGLHPLTHRMPSSGEVAVRYAFATAIALAYYPPLMVATNGQTIGKRLLGIRVVRTDRREMNWRRAALREVAVKQVLFGVLGLIPGVGPGIGVIVSFADILWPLGDAENRALHDMLAGTRVRLAGRTVGE